jgi:hypothetical protein
VRYFSILRRWRQRQTAHCFLYEKSDLETSYCLGHRTTKPSLANRRDSFRKDFFSCFALYLLRNIPSDILSHLARNGHIMCSEISFLDLVTRSSRKISPSRSTSPIRIQSYAIDGLAHLTVLYSQVPAMYGKPQGMWCRIGIGASISLSERSREEMGSARFPDRVDRVPHCKSPSSTTVPAGTIHGSLEQDHCQLIQLHRHTHHYQKHHLALSQLTVSTANSPTPPHHPTPSAPQPY